MNSNAGPVGDTSRDTSSDAFKALKRKARSVRARPRKRKTGGAGVATSAGQETHIDKLNDKNILEKAPVAHSDAISPPFSRQESPETTHVSVAKALTREDNWRGMGDIKAEIAGRSLNPRILEILLPSGERARAIVKPSEHPKFGQKRPVWVRKDERGKHWVVIGRYSQWGVRCE